MTPHPGEFPADRAGHSDHSEPAAGAGGAFAAEHGVVLVLKGQGTVVTTAGGSS